jgi:hypothetical protein
MLGFLTGFHVGLYISVSGIALVYPTGIVVHGVDDTGMLVHVAELTVGMFDQGRFGVGITVHPYRAKVFSGNTTNASVSKTVSL